MDKTGLQQWVDMYNKADKERFEALLQRDKYKNTLDEIEGLLTTCKNNLGKPCEECKYTNQCTEIDTDNWILQKIKEVKGE